MGEAKASPPVVLLGLDFFFDDTPYVLENGDIEMLCYCFEIGQHIGLEINLGALHNPNLSWKYTPPLYTIFVDVVVCPSVKIPKFPLSKADTQIPK
jgi:hypothetical protein